ncbi:MAG: ABC transporter permease [Planctomycetaceae bacterium]|nr:ABC transporter permease [Planctomycetaceae bacterium]
MAGTRTDQSPASDWDVVYDSEPPKVGFITRIAGGFGNLWHSRQLAWRLFQRNFLANYRQSVLGWLWIFLPPLSAAGVWVFLNASGTVRISSLSPVGYAAFVFCGMLLWQAFIDGLTGPINTLQSNRSALTKLQFPREVFVTLCLLETGFDFLVRVLVATLFLVIAGLINWGGIVLLIAVWGPLLLILGVGFGLWLAPFGLLYKDVSRSIAMVSPLWMLLTPVIYDLPGGTPGQVVAWLNPPAAVIHVARSGAIQEAEPTFAKSSTASDYGKDDGTINTNRSGEPHRSEPPPLDSAPWPAVVSWCALGVVLFLLGLVWLDLSSPIVIERLAN